MFTKPERLAFEKEVLWPAAGVDPSRVEEFYAVQDLVKQLNYATNEAARRYVNGEIDAKAAAIWLQRASLLLVYNQVSMSSTKRSLCERCDVDVISPEVNRNS